jgi:hypothetical protein
LLPNQTREYGMYLVHVDPFINTQFNFYLEHLQQCSICDLALEIVDEVHQSNLVNSPKPLKIPTSFQSPGGALVGSNEQSQIVFIDCFVLLPVFDRVDSLNGPSGLL